MRCGSRPAPAAGCTSDSASVRRSCLPSPVSCAPSGLDHDASTHTPRKIRRASSDSLSSTADVSQQLPPLDDTDDADDRLMNTILPAVSSLLTTCEKTEPSTPVQQGPAAPARPTKFDSPCSVTQPLVPLDDNVASDSGASATETPRKSISGMTPVALSLQARALMTTLPSHDLVRMRQHVQMPATLLPPKTSNKKITLVLDLDETLVHCGFKALPAADIELHIDYLGTPYTVFGRRRPHLEAFLKEASQHFELVCFTASQKLYAERIVKIIDPNGYISHCLFRESCVKVRGNFLKDLSILGRDLRHTLLLDNSPYAFGFQVDNGVPIVSWFDDESDLELPATLDWLKSVASADDVRPLVAEKFRLRQRLAPRFIPHNSFH